MPITSNTIILLFGFGCLLLFSALSLQVIFTKLNEYEWKAWVPGYNLWTFFANAGMSGAWAFALLAPILGQVVILIAVYKISEFLGFRGAPLVWLGLFLPPVCLAVLALSRNKSDAEIEALYY